MPEISTRYLSALRRLALATLMALLPSVLLAHSFNALLIVPAGADAAPIRADMQTAFLIAAQERDNHPDNHADGHLGGLDVYLTLATDAEALQLSEPQIDILAAPLATVADPDLTRIATILNAVLATAGVTKNSADVTTPPNLPPFADRFASETGHPPGPEANAAYLIARQIETAVRDLGGVDDTTQLQYLLTGQ